MAGDWIKMRPSLLTSPKVNAIARILERSRDVSQSLSTGFNGHMSEIVKRNVMRNVTVASLLIVWGAANEHTVDGIFRNADLSDIDDMVGIPGFGDAMESVGWAEFDEEMFSVTLPNFSEYNTCGKDRSSEKNAERQRRFREKKKESNPDSNVTQDVTNNDREEKKREEKNKEPSNPNGLLVDSEADRRKTERRSDCPHQEIIALYHEVLPMCPQIRDWTAARAQQLRARWNEAPARQNLDYWRGFFDYVKTCDFLVGKTPKPFFADLEWLTKSGNFAKVREGRYENKVTA